MELNMELVNRTGEIWREGEMVKNQSKLSGIVVHVIKDGLSASDHQTKIQETDSTDKGNKNY